MSTIANTTESDLVLLIHGTFAGRAADEGAAWWQRGSAAWCELEKRLPEGTEMPTSGDVFHWSGDNSERARIKAGQDLLDRLEQLEAEGRGYHLIGHSHGGSVIWHALRLATLRHRPLKRLKSWATVGTPFLHYRTRGAWSLANIVNLVLALMLLRPAYNAFSGFLRFAWAAFVGNNTTLDIHGDHDVGIVMATFRAPLLKIVEWLGVPVRTTELGLRLGSYDPATGESLARYMFGTWEGWVITAVVFIGGYSFLLLATLCLNPVIESLRIRSEKRLEQAAIRRFRGRWLGLWSTSDEAINGLRATLDLSVSFVAQITPRERVLFSDYLLVLALPYQRLMTPIFNRFVRPILDGAVRSFVTKTAQGNNRPAAEVIAVLPFPEVDGQGTAVPPALPDDVHDQLVERANEHARDFAPKLRDLLAAPSFVTGLERFGSALSGRELIHTSYFDHGPILDLLAMHLAWACQDHESMERAAWRQAGLWKWFCQFKHSVQETAVRPRAARPAERRAA